jgi:large subunit ribosomal protein L32
MAVPKKRTSKAKKNARKANWKRKGYKAAQKSLSLAKSMLRGKTTSFVYKLFSYNYIIFKIVHQMACHENLP